MKEIVPEVLIISNRYDFSSDFIAVELNRLKIPYWRINRDELDEYEIQFNPLTPSITGRYKDIRFEINSNILKSVYFRAPTFLRDIYQDEASEEEQLKRTQWAAFVRSLCVFDKAIWVNNPAEVYRAEIKSYQLYIANKIGFSVPETVITNKTFVPKFDKVAIKTIDTAIINLNDEEGFIYTELYDKEDITEQHFSSPFFLQQGLIPKQDIRVTVINETVIAVKILQEDKQGVNFDWRRYKDGLLYEIFELPDTIKDKCKTLLKELNLKFGGIDLAFHNEEYYFIEINPTGEWSWLQQNTGYKYDEHIVEALYPR